MTQMRWQCTEKGCYLQRRSDPVMFDGCFPAGVSMGDVDGIVELNGRFLIVEFKKLNISVPEGQARMFRRLVATGLFTILVVRAAEQHVEEWFEVTVDGSWRTYAGDSENLRDHVISWTQSVDPRLIALQEQQRPPS